MQNQIDEIHYRDVLQNGDALQNDDAIGNVNPYIRTTTNRSIRYCRHSESTLGHSTLNI